MDLGGCQAPPWVFVAVKGTSGGQGGACICVCIGPPVGVCEHLFSWKCVHVNACVHASLCLHCGVHLEQNESLVKCVFGCAYVRKHMPSYESKCLYWGTCPL